MRTIPIARFAWLLPAAMLAAVPAAAVAQSSASSYSYGTYNPVQAAINRNSMNAAIIKQATGHKAKTTKHISKTQTHRP